MHPKLIKLLFLSRVTPNQRIKTRKTTIQTQFHRCASVHFRQKCVLFMQSQNAVNCDCGCMHQKLVRLLFSVHNEISTSQIDTFLNSVLSIYVGSLPVETCSLNAALECGKLPPWMHRQLIKLLFSACKQVIRQEKPGNI